MNGDALHSALMDAFDVVCSFPPDAIVRRGPGYRVISIPSIPINLANAVWFDGPDEDAILEDLPASLAEIEASGRPPVAIVREGETPRVHEEARRLGLTLEERMPGMAVDSRTFRPPPPIPGVEMLAAGGDPALLDTALDVTTRGFEVPREWFASLFATGMRADGLELWLAYVDGEPVSTSLGIVRGDAVGIFDVATPPEHRRKGYGALVTTHAVAAGFDAGASFAYLQSSDMGFPIYEALGFRTVTTYVALERPTTPAGSNAP